MLRRASALVEIGDVTRARDLCEKLLSFASPLGLYAEEIDPRTGRHLGNFPQAFTHLALINAVATLMSLGAYPIWSVMILVLDGLVIYALTVYGTGRATA